MPYEVHECKTFENATKSRQWVSSCICHERAAWQIDRCVCTQQIYHLIIQRVAWRARTSKLIYIDSERCVRVRVKLNVTGNLLAWCEIGYVKSKEVEQRQRERERERGGGGAGRYNGESGRDFSFVVCWLHRWLVALSNNIKGALNVVVVRRRPVKDEQH